MRGAPVMITILASELESGDFVAGEGIVTYASRIRKQIVAVIGPRSIVRVLSPQQSVRVHIEDDGLDHEEE